MRIVWISGGGTLVPDGSLAEVEEAHPPHIADLAQQFRIIAAKGGMRQFQGALVGCQRLMVAVGEVKRTGSGSVRLREIRIDGERAVEGCDRPFRPHSIPVCTLQQANSGEVLAHGRSVPLQPFTCRALDRCSALGFNPGNVSQPGALGIVVRGQRQQHHGRHYRTRQDSPDQRGRRAVTAKPAHAFRQRSVRTGRHLAVFLPGTQIRDQ